VRRSRTRGCAYVKRDRAFAPVGDENLPAHSFARTLVQAILDYSDDFNVELGVGSTSPTQMAPDRALFAKIVSSEAAVDNGHLGILLHVARVKIAAFENGNSHGLEITRGERVHERLHVFPVFGLMALDRGAAVPLPSVQQRNGCKTCGLDTRD